MLDNFNKIFNECLNANLVTFYSDNYYLIDTFQSAIKYMITHTHYTIDSQTSYNYFIENIESIDDKVVFIDLLYNPQSGLKTFRTFNKTFFVFKPTYNSNGIYSLPRVMTYESDIIYQVKDNMLICMKHRYANPNNIKCNFNNILRYEKIKRLMK